jgi:hypothetical protein
MIIDLVFTFKYQQKFPRFLDRFWKSSKLKFVQMNDCRFASVGIECVWPQVSSFNANDAILHIIKSENPQNIECSTWAAILAVPALFTPRDLLMFLDCLSPNILHVYLLKDSNTGRYMAILQLRDVESRSCLIRELDGVYVIVSI